MTRVALYARYSSDNQRENSIEDQFRICRERANREAWEIVATYDDAGISGASMILRPGIQALLHDAKRRQFDIVLSEALDRISRDQADVARLFKHLQFAGVPIITLAEGEINELHIGLKGTMNALFLKDLAAKTHRGLRGRIEQGKSGGGVTYGYRVVKTLDARGDPIRGERVIDEAQAAIVRRILKQFASGIAPLAIANELNAHGIAGPNGNLWLNATIRGHAKRGTGIINNELYVGRLIWNRQRFMNNPSTGRRTCRMNPAAEWITTEVPELRIVDDALWQSVKARQRERTRRFAHIIDAVRVHRASRLNACHRPRSLFSGLIHCGVCGGPYSLRGQARFACWARVSSRSCSNSRTILSAYLEEQVLAGLKDQMIAPEIASEAMRAYVGELKRHKDERRAHGASWRSELAKVEKAISRIITAIAEGLYEPSMKSRMEELERQKASLMAQLAEAPAEVPDTLPDVLGVYQKKVEHLATALNSPEEQAEAASAIRGLVEQITLLPGPNRRKIDVVLQGELSRLLGWIGVRTIGRARNKRRSRRLRHGSVTIGS